MTEHTEHGGHSGSLLLLLLAMRSHKTSCLFMWWHMQSASASHAPGTVHCIIQCGSP